MPAPATYQPQAPGLDDVAGELSTLKKSLTTLAKDFSDYAALARDGATPTALDGINHAASVISDELGAVGKSMTTLSTDYQAMSDALKAQYANAGATIVNLNGQIDSLNKQIKDLNSKLTTALNASGGTTKAGGGVTTKQNGQVYVTAGAAAGIALAALALGGTGGYVVRGVLSKRKGGTAEESTAEVEQEEPKKRLRK
jgi:hypothetical protein